MDDAARSLDTVVSGLRLLLIGRGLHRQAHLLAELPSVPAVRVGQGQPLRVLEHLPAAEHDAVKTADWELAAAAVHLARVASWTQTQAYVDRPPHRGFLDQYAHATLAGPQDGAAPTSAGSRATVSVGLLLLGPEVCYPAHQHPADEVYLPLTAAHWWDERIGEYTPRAPGSLIHHRPRQPHGMQTSGQPLLALYCWTGDVSTPAEFC